MTGSGVVEETEPISGEELGVSLEAARPPMSWRVRKGLKDNRIWRFLSSMTLALWLFTGIALVSLAGTLVPQTELYHTGWFLSLLAALALNLLVCLSNRFVLNRKMAGSFLAHGSILVILIGALTGLLWGKSGFLPIREGETVSRFVLNDKIEDLSFSVKLNDFVYEELVDSKEKLEVYSEDSRLIVELPTKIGSEAEIMGTASRIRVLNYVSDFSMDLTTRQVISRSAEPRNPALQVELLTEGGLPQTFWVFAAYPDIHNPVRSGFKFKYHWRERRPGDFVSHLTVIQGGGEVLRKEVRVNDPLRFKGYSFFQSSYDREHLKWSGLKIVRDPGVPVVYAGFVMLIVGLCLLYYRNLVLRKAG